MRLLLLLAACAGPRLHLDMHTVQGPARNGPESDKRIEDTCAVGFHVAVTDDENVPAAGIPVHVEMDSVERCAEETIARHTFRTEKVLTDAAGHAATCEPAKLLPTDPWNGIGGCVSIRTPPRLVVGTGSKQVVKAEPFTDGMKVALRHGVAAP